MVKWCSALRSKQQLQIHIFALLRGIRCFLSCVLNCGCVCVCVFSVVVTTDMLSHQRGGGEKKKRSYTKTVAILGFILSVAGDRGFPLMGLLWFLLDWSKEESLRDIGFDAAGRKGRLLSTRSFRNCSHPLDLARLHELYLRRQEDKRYLSARDRTPPICPLPQKTLTNQRLKHEIWALEMVGLQWSETAAVTVQRNPASVPVQSIWDFYSRFLRMISWRQPVSKHHVLSPWNLPVAEVSSHRWT